MSVRISHKWLPLEDLPPGWDQLVSSELAALASVWQEQRGLLEQTDALQSFNERLQRKWAIETGVIEKAYTLDRGITQVLIERGIDAAWIPRSATDKDPQLVAAMIRDHKDAVEGLFTFVKGNRSLSVGYINELHVVLLAHQATSTAVDQFGRFGDVLLEKGRYKQLPNSPTREDGSIHEYAPPEQVASEMERLVELHRAHERAGVPPEVAAAWLHHRFTQIHPYQDGNGRVARALATLIFIRAGLFPLAVTRDDLEYIDALGAADRGQLDELIDLFVRIERNALIGALGVADSALQHQQVDQVIKATRDLFERRRRAQLQEWLKAKELARALQTLTNERLNEVARKLDAEIRAYNPSYRFRVDNESLDSERDHFFRQQIVETAKALGYFANTAPGYRSWSRLVLNTDTQAELLFSFHAIGHEFRGLFAVSACFFRREETETGERQVGGLITVCDEVFQINYRDDPQQAEERYERWLDRSLVKALEIWRAGL